MPDYKELVSVFEEARELLALPDNEYMWSSWEDDDDALEEIDRILAELRAGAPLDRLTMRVLFAPTGPIQEVAISSGWGNRFLTLADRFDAAMEADVPLQHPVPYDTCSCLSTPLGLQSVISEYGMDASFAEISLLRCRECGRIWLRYFYELEAVTGSGRWYLGAIMHEQIGEVTVENAKEILAGLDWYFYGGSYYDGRVGKKSGTL
jgi:hypothetical protein